MKFSSVAILAALVAITLSAAVAAPANKKTIDLFEPTIVGRVTLTPGQYTIEWNGPGPDVQVTFSQGKNTILTVPATLEAAQNWNDIAVTCRTEESGARSLVTIKTKSSTLHFAPPSVSGGQ
jgi:hypothetical protein